MGTLTVTGSSSGLASGQKIIGPITITGNNMVGTITDANLATGDNVFAMPSFPPSGQPTAVLICLGNAPAVTVKVRTNLDSGDAGLAIAPYSGVGFAVFPIVAGVTELILNASGAVQGIELSYI